MIVACVMYDVACAAVSFFPVRACILDSYDQASEKLAEEAWWTG